MEILLVRSAEVDSSFLDEVEGLLQQFPGPLQFCSHPEPLKFQGITGEKFQIDDPSRWKTKERLCNYELVRTQSKREYKLEEPAPKVLPDITLAWKELFSSIDRYREIHQIPAQQHVILLTDQHNTPNWFCTFDPTMRLNYFIQTSLWHEFIEGGRRFPVAYEAIALVVRRLAADTFSESIDRSHERPKGCLYDRCMDKEQIALKLRTADICPDCMKWLISKGISNTVIVQALAVFESIRRQMLFSQHFISTQTPSRLLVKGDKMDLILQDLDNTKICLNPLQKVVYLFFLNHPEGIRTVDLDSHIEELLALYRRVSNAESEEAMRRSIGLLCNPLDNSLHEKLARIRTIIRSLLGEQLGDHYQIQRIGENRVIMLARNLVEWESGL